MIKSWALSASFAFCAVCEAASLSCTSSFGYQAMQAWPFDHLSITPLFAPVCTPGRAPVCSPLPNALGATAQLEGDVIAVDLYGSDTTLPSGVPATSGIPVVVGPLIDGIYRTVVRVHNVDEHGNVSSCDGRLGYPPNVRIRLPTGPLEVVAAVEFYNASLDHYFLTIDPREIMDLDRGVHRGWTRTGRGFNVFAPGKSGGTGAPVCRFYGLPSAGLDSHFYTASAAECAEIPIKYNGAWQLESPNAFEVWLVDTPQPQRYCNPSVAEQEIIRLWNQRVDSNHRYLTDGNLLLGMLMGGWVEEGVGYPSPASGMCYPL